VVPGCIESRIPGFFRGFHVGEATLDDRAQALERRGRALKPFVGNGVEQGTDEGLQRWRINLSIYFHTTG